MKTGRSFIYRAAMDYMIRNSTYWKFNFHLLRAYPKSH
jgi:hypothetical protein